MLISRNVLDSSTISSLYQLLSLLIISIAVYLYKKVNEQITGFEQVIKINESLMFTFDFALKVNNYSSSMIIFSKLLKEESDDINYVSGNLYYCSKINDENEKLRKILIAFNKNRFETNADKAILVRLYENYEEILIRFKDDLKLKDFGSYYQDIYDRLKEIQDFIKDSMQYK